MKSINAYVRPAIAALTPYSTARDEYKGELGVFLDANESPYENGYNRYPDPHQKALKAQIAAIKGIAAENIFIGNGSDEAIDMVFRVFCEPRLDNVVAIAPITTSYGIPSLAYMPHLFHFILESFEIILVHFCTYLLSTYYCDLFTCMHARLDQSLQMDSS